MKTARVFPQMIASKTGFFSKRVFPDVVLQ